MGEFLQNAEKSQKESLDTDNSIIRGKEGGSSRNDIVTGGGRIPKVDNVICIHYFLLLGSLPEAFTSGKNG